MPFLDTLGPWVWIAPVILVGLLTLPYTIGPVLVYLFTKVSARPEVEEFFLEDRGIPRLVLNFVDDTLEDLEPDGFAVLGAFYMDTLIANVRSFLVLVGKEETREMALIAVTYAGSGNTGGQIQQTHVEFSTRFLDESSIDTNNSEELGAFTPLADHPIYSFPWVPDVRRLYRIHQAIVNRDRPNDERDWLDGEDPGDLLEKSLADALARQVPNGCLRPSGPKHYRLTFSTAARAIYQNLWPFKSMAKARRRRRGEALLRDLGFTNDGVRERHERTEE